MIPPFFSVILPVYNREALVGRAIESVLAQTFENWELLIVDDGSTDNTAATVLNYAEDKRIRYFYQENAERSAARNNGLDNAAGKFICFIDSDDYYLPDHLQVLYSRIHQEHEKQALYYTHYFIEKDGIRKPGPLFGDRIGNGLLNLMRDALLQTNSVCVSGELLKRNRFPLEFSLFEDNHVWFRVIAESEMIWIPAQTTVMTDHDARSLKVDKSAFHKKVVAYVSVLSDLLLQKRYPEIDRILSDSEKRRFVASKLIVLTYEAMLLGLLWSAYRLLFRSVSLHFDRSRITEYLKLFFGLPFGVLNAGRKRK